MKILILLIMCIIFSHKQMIANEKPKNIILVIGDGMGDAQLELASLYFTGESDGLRTQKIPFRSKISTTSVNGDVTDSAAAATAMATGIKTQNGYVGRDFSAHDQKNLFEMARESGRRTGIITNVAISHATPAGFAAHADHRTQSNRIVDSILSSSRPNILFGAATEINPEWARFKGYDVLSNSIDLKNYVPNTEDFLISGQFGEDSLPWYKDNNQVVPSLPIMSAKALELLSKSTKGFLLLIESGKIDWAAHHSDLLNTIYEVKALDDTVKVIQLWMANRNDTLLIVTADHETGGLSYQIPDAPKINQLPQYQWLAPIGSDGTLTHTSEKVSVFGMGLGAENISNLKTNTDIFKLIVDLHGY